MDAPDDRFELFPRLRLGPGSAMSLTVTSDVPMCFSLVFTNSNTFMHATVRVTRFVALLFVLVFGQFLSSCSQNSNPSDVQAGSLTGVVSLGSEGASSPMPMASSAGVSISLDGTAYSTTSDSSGFWEFNNLPAGTYNVTITKPGFGLDRIYGVAVGGPGTNFIPQVDLGELPSQGPQLLSANIVYGQVLDSVGDTLAHRYDTLKELQIRRSVPLSIDYHGLCIFIDKDSTTQPGDVHWLSSIDGVGPVTWEGIWYDSVIVCPISELHAAGIPSGATVYISLAQNDPYSINGIAPNDKITYFDPVHNQNRIISPSPRSNVVAITIP